MVKKRLLFFGVILSFVFFAGISSAFAEEILDFHSDITIQENSNFLVQETIVYDFGNLQKHGIYRDISQENLSVKIEKVIDEGGVPYNYAVSKRGNIISVKIGDADKTISGVHTYIIYYSVVDGLGFFENHDELYWNVTGNNWQYPIEKSSAKIILPQEMKEANLQYTCYTGSYGSKEKNCNWQIDGDGNVFFENKESLLAGQGLTVVLGWPKGIVKEPTINPIIDWFKKFWPIFIPVLFFVFLFRRWWKKGRDYPLKGPVIAQYEPPEGLKPAQVAMIKRQSFKNIDVSATIIDLAVKGYIKIKEIEKKGIFGSKDYEIIKIKNIGNDVSFYEKIIFQSLFAAGKSLPLFLTEDEKKKFINKIFLQSSRLSTEDVVDKIFSSDTTETSKKISEIREDFYSFLPSIGEKIYSEMTSLGYFEDNPKSIRVRYIIFGSFVLTIISLFVYLAQALSFSALFFLFISFIILIFFSLVMPKRTKKGAEAYWHILGFKEFIERAEKYRLQFAEKENIFEQYLPYAIIFGCVDKWAKTFEGIYQTPPSWYEGHYTDAFTTSAFIGSFNGALSSMNSMASSGAGGSGGSGFGGGGFSGGGGGGGGGGSW